MSCREIQSSGTCRKGHVGRRLVGEAGFRSGPARKTSGLGGRVPGGEGACQPEASAQAEVQRCVVARMGHSKARLPRAAGAPGTPARAPPRAHPEKTPREGPGGQRRAWEGRGGSEATGVPAGFPHRTVGQVWPRGQRAAGGWGKPGCLAPGGRRARASTN